MDRGISSYFFSHSNHPQMTACERGPEGVLPLLSIWHEHDGCTFNASTRLLQKFKPRLRDSTSMIHSTLRSKFCKTLSTRVGGRHQSRCVCECLCLSLFRGQFVVTPLQFFAPAFVIVCGFISYLTMQRDATWFTASSLSPSLSHSIVLIAHIIWCSVFANIM